MEITKENPLFPDCLRQYDIKIFTGGCVNRGEGSRFRAKAHAHIRNDKNKGWICFLSARRLSSKELCLHEVAHSLTNERHSDKWRKKVMEIGGTLDEVPGILKSYHKKG